ncbi:MAG: 3-oxoacyl-[Clostridia bacterium]|nr:3-oxoacyl-[acyl-carrier-protein] reductase [Clostridia bacterium]
MSFLNQTAVVTGGSRGIGRAICLELASHGANIVLCYAGNEQAAEQTAQDCRALGARVTAVKCDVSDNQAVKDMMKAAVKEYGRIDILVNNAGVTRDGFLLMMRESDYDTVLDTNLKGTFLCMKHVVHAMMKQNYGRIVNLSSVSGIRGNAGQANYAASKAGVVGLTKAAAKELAAKNITVNAVAPGFIETDMTAAMTDAAKAATLAMIPAARLGQAQEVARAVVFLAGKDAAYITGQVLCVDGGMAM